MSIERTYTGIYECPECEIEYTVDREPEGELFCEECGGDLEEVDEDSDEDGNED